MIPAKLLNTLIALALSGILGYMGYQAHIEFEKKHKQQETNFTKLRDSRLRLDAVEEYGELFRQSFEDISDTDDMLTLYENLNIGSVTGVSPDSVKVVSITQMKAGRNKLPLYEVCLASGSQGFSVYTVTVEQALEVMGAIDARPDIRYKTLAFRKNEDRLEVRYDSLCVLGRV